MRHGRSRRVGPGRRIRRRRIELLLLDIGPGRSARRGGRYVYRSSYSGNEGFDNEFHSVHNGNAGYNKLSMKNEKGAPRWAYGIFLGCMAGAVAMNAFFAYAFQTTPLNVDGLNQPYQLVTVDQRGQFIQVPNSYATST